MLISEMAFLRDHWHPVLPSTVLEHDPVPVTLFGERWVVWRDGDQTACAAPDRCPHRGGSLSHGWVDRGRITCPYHGWQYGTGGQCEAIPYLDAGAAIPSKARLAVVQVREAYGLVWMCVGDPVGPLPSWPEADSGRFDVRVEFFEPVQGSALRYVDNALDLSHITYVHQSTFGEPGALVVPPVPDVAATEHGFVGTFEIEIPGVGAQMGLDVERYTRFQRQVVIEVLSPVQVRTQFAFTEFPDGSRDYGFLMAAVPVDDERSIYVRATALSSADSSRSWDEFHEFSTRVLSEDKVILDQAPADFSPNVVDEVHVRHDRLTVEYRRYLAGLVAAEPGGTR